MSYSSLEKFSICGKVGSKTVEVRMVGGRGLFVSATDMQLTVAFLPTITVNDNIFWLPYLNHR